MTKKKPTLWERTKDIATTYTGTFIVVMILNQLLFFGLCLNPICLIAAMPHVLLITVAIGTVINKISNWGEDQTARKTTQSIGRGIHELAVNLNTTLDEINKAADIQHEKAIEKRKELEKRKVNLYRNHVKQAKPKFDLDKYRPPKTTLVDNNVRISENLSNSENDLGTQLHTLKTDRCGHQKVFITRNNLNSIIQKVDQNRFTLKDFESLYHRPLSQILSHKELALLCIYKEVCLDPNTVFESYKDTEFSKVKDMYVFERETKSYHKNQDCDLLHGDYFNIEIPMELKVKGKFAINSFRDFCIKNRVLLETDEKKFLYKLQANFMLINPPTTIKASNSGVKEFENIDLNMVEQQINSLLVDAEHYRNASDQHNDIIMRLGYGSHRVKETREIKNPLHTWHYKYKLPLKELLRHYFRIKFNEDMSFDGLLLDKLGLKPCKKCFAE